jgi:hypothetical protein
MLKALRELLSDGTGALSVMRVMDVSVVAVVLALLITQNVVAICAGKGFVDMPVNCLAALVAVIGGKVAQNYTEKKAE